MTFAAWAASALCFSFAALIGTTIAQHLYAACLPFEDGPRPAAVTPLPFALSAAVLGWMTASHTSDPRVLAVMAVIVLALAACAFSDLRWGVIPDAITLPALGIVTTVAALRNDTTPITGALFVGVPFVLLALLTRGRGMGWGDVKLALLGGALLGAGQATVTMSAACVATSAVSVGRSRKTPLPLGAMLAAAIALTLALDPLR